MKTFINKKTIGILMATLLIINLTLYHYFLAVSISWAAESVVAEEQSDESDEEDVDDNEEQQQEEDVDESEDEEDIAGEEEELEEDSEEKSEEGEEESEEAVNENSYENNEEEVDENNASEDFGDEESQVEENFSEEESEFISQANLDEQEGEIQNGGDQINLIEVGDVENEESNEDNLNINVTEESENFTESVSDTGENSISNTEEEEEIIYCDEEELSAEEDSEDLSEEELLNETSEENEKNEENENSDLLENDCIPRETDSDNKDVLDEEALALEDEQTLNNGLESEEEGLIENAEILTGDAEAQAVSVSEINTNIVTENGEKEIINIEDGSTEDLNLLDIFKKILEGENEEDGDEETLNEEGEVQVEVKNINIATEVKNVVVAVAETGENIIKNAEEFANIETGDAEAVAAVINLINTNIVGDNWYLAVVNILGDWTGDLIVPGEGLLTASDIGMKIGNVININEASGVENSVVALADTGENLIDGATGDSTMIETGEASSSASVFNMINTNVVSNNWFFLIINDAGNWVGQVINWGDDGEKQLVYEYDLGSSYVNSDGTIVDVYNYNSATNVTNSVQAIANTGENEINNSGDSSITTGDANAWASVFNFINTNIVGNNWFFGIVNNLGNWKGDLVFAYPDLEVSIDSSKEDIEPGESMTYIINYKNIGEADCENIELMLSLPDYIISQEEGEDELFFSFPGLNSGEEKSFKVAVDSMGEIPNEIEALTGLVGVRTDTEEPETSNNYASIETGVMFPEEFVEEVFYDFDFDFDYNEDEYSLEVDRREEKEISLGEIATYSILVENTGEHSVYNIEVKEKVRDPFEDVVAEYYWIIGELEENQTALIEYQVFFDEFAPLGVYNHRASALGYTEYSDEVKSDKIFSDVGLIFGNFAQAESFIEEEPEILPVADTSESLPTRTLGVGLVRSSFNWNWAWFPLILLVIYLVKNNNLHQLNQWQKLSRRFTGFF